MQLDGSVSVGANVQSRFSPESSGDLFVDVEFPDGDVFRLLVARLCGGPPARYPIHWTRFGCAPKTLTVKAWAAPHDPEFAPAIRLGCDTAAKDPSSSEMRGGPPDAVRGSASQTVSVDSRGSGACKNGKARFELTLEPAAGAGG